MGAKLPLIVTYCIILSSTQLVWLRLFCLPHMIAIYSEQQPHGLAIHIYKLSLLSRCGKNIPEYCELQADMVVICL